MFLQAAEQPNSSQLHVVRMRLAITIVLVYSINACQLYPLESCMAKGTSFPC